MIHNQKLPIRRRNVVYTITWMRMKCTIGGNGTRKQVFACKVFGASATYKNYLYAWLLLHECVSKDNELLLYLITFFIVICSENLIEYLWICVFYWQSTLLPNLYLIWYSTDLRRLFKFDNTNNSSSVLCYYYFKWT